MRTVLPWQLAVALLTATPLSAGAAPPADGTAAPAPPPAAKPAAAASTAAKPAAAAPPTGPKSATATPASPARPATAPTPGAAKPAGAPTAAAAKPATPGPAAPGQPKPATPPVGAASPPNTDPAKADVSLAQATFGIKGVGALFATIEIAVPSRPVVQALHCELFADKTPLTVANFVALARGLRPWKDPKLGQWVKKPLYDGNLVHRVIPELLIQGGDPSCTVDPTCRGTAGLGAPGYTIPDEIRPELRFDRPGRLAMANRGPASGGSQFFITERDAPWLTGSHTIFGQCDGAELVTELAHVDVGARDQPKVPLVIKRVTFIRKTK